MGIPRDGMRERKTIMHTPGPWVFDEEVNGAYRIWGASPRGVVCSRARWPRRAKESHANGKLIAAAPKMYDLLKKLEANIPKYDNGHFAGEWLEIQSLLKEIEGKS